MGIKNEQTYKSPREKMWLWEASNVLDISYGYGFLILDVPLAYCLPNTNMQREITK